MKSTKCKRYIVKYNRSEFMLRYQNIDTKWFWLGLIRKQLYVLKNEVWNSFVSCRKKTDKI